MKLAIVFIVLAGLKANAAVQFDQFYTDASGKRIESSEALISSVRGQTIYKCQTVETKLSKSGNSIGIHNVKKPKIAKD